MKHEFALVSQLRWYQLLYSYEVKYNYYGNIHNSVCASIGPRRTRFNTFQHASIM